MGIKSSNHQLWANSKIVLSELVLKITWNKHILKWVQSSVISR